MHLLNIFIKPSFSIINVTYKMNKEKRLKVIVKFLHSKSHFKIFVYLQKKIQTIDIVN